MRPKQSSQRAGFALFAATLSRCNLGSANQERGSSSPKPRADGTRGHTCLLEALPWSHPQSLPKHNIQPVSREGGPPELGLWNQLEDRSLQGDRKPPWRFDIPSALLLDDPKRAPLDNAKACRETLSHEAPDWQSAYRSAGDFVRGPSSKRYVT